MPKDTTAGKPTTRRYSPEEKAAAVRMVRSLRAELGTERGTVHRVATQLGYGVESVRSWARQADIDEGHVAGVSTNEVARMTGFEQENRELRRANEILKRAASFFGAELDRQHRKYPRSSNANRDDVVAGRRLGVELICSVLQVAPSSYYELKNRQPSARAQRDEVMGPVVRELWEDNYRVYGARRSGRPPGVVVTTWVVTRSPG